MRSPALFLATAVWASIVAGCAPENSLFPICTKEESLFNERLIGVWRTQESPTETKSEDGYLISDLRRIMCGSISWTMMGSIKSKWVSWAWRI